MSTLISVVIPCHNVEGCVEDAIKSILKQTYSPLELILIDNDSTDQTWPILRAYASRFKHISCFQKKERGATVARNKGLFEANGEWIQFLDADDILLPNKIQHQQGIIQCHDGEFDVVAGSYIFRTLLGSEEEVVPEKDIWLGLLKGKLGITSANLWNRRAIIQAGGWDQSLTSSQEYELLFQILKRNERVLFDSKYNTIIRQRKGSVSTTNLQDNEQIAAKLRIRIYKYLVAEQKITAESKSDFLQVLLQYLARLGMSDPDLAAKTFRKYYPKGFKVENSLMGRFYTLSFNLFGFESAQFLYKYYIYLRSLIIGRIPRW